MLAAIVACDDNDVDLIAACGSFVAMMMMVMIMLALLA